MVRSQKASDVSLLAFASQMCWFDSIFCGWRHFLVKHKQHYPVFVRKYLQISYYKLFVLFVCLCITPLKTKCSLSCLLLKTFRLAKDRTSLHYVDSKSLRYLISVYCILYSKYRILWKCMYLIFKSKYL